MSILALKAQIDEPLVYRLPLSALLDYLPYADDSVSNKEMKEAYKLIKAEMATFSPEEKDYLADCPIPPTPFIDSRLINQPNLNEPEGELKKGSRATMETREESQSQKGPEPQTGSKAIRKEEQEVMKRTEYLTNQYLNLEIMRLYGKDLKQLCIYDLDKTLKSLQEQLEKKEEALKQIHSKRKFHQVSLPEFLL